MNCTSMCATDRREMQIHKSICRNVMCSTALISKWHMDYSKYAVSITDQKKLFGGGEGPPQMRYNTNFFSSPARNPLSFSYSSTLFLFLFFVLPWNSYVFCVSSVSSLTLALLWPRWFLSVFGSISLGRFELGVKLHFYVIEGQRMCTVKNTHTLMRT